MKKKLFETFNFEGNFKYLKEDNGSMSDMGVTPTAILGVIQGPIFKLDGYSENGRFYPKKLWEQAINQPEFQHNLKNKRLFACIGHPEGNYTIDELLASGKTAAILTDVSIKKGTGYGTFEILNTPSGRILDTLLKAGSKLTTSTRGYGEEKDKYVERDGKKYKVIDEDSYFLESVDFVFTGGVINDYLEYKENLKEVKEDVKLIAESKDLSCIDGLCKISEALEEEPEETQSKEKPEKEEEGKDIIPKEDESNDLYKLNKKQLINLIENLVKENTTLLKEIEIVKFKEPEPTKEEKHELTKKEVNIINLLNMLLQQIRLLSNVKDEYEKLLLVLEKSENFPLDIDTIEEQIKSIKEKLNDIEDKDNKKEIEELLNGIEKEIKSKEDTNENFLTTINNYYKLLTEKAINIILKENKNIPKESNNTKQYKEIIEALTKELEKKENIIKDLKENISDYNKKIKKIKENFNILKEKYENLNEKYNNINEENSILKKDIISLKEDINKTVKKYNTIIKENKELKEKALKLNEGFRKYLVEYYSLLYKVPRDVVNEKIMNESDIEKVKMFFKNYHKKHLNETKNNNKEGFIGTDIVITNETYEEVDDSVKLIEKLLK